MQSSKIKLNWSRIPNPEIGVVIRERRWRCIHTSTDTARGETAT